ncbi:hypothetical protein SUGI_0142150 [Cryptomeria japonica]|uniref:uncharacterized protein LOC131075342 n=1 Tax=Cryptomeria japonica TaxID=3369 RepID=UPI002408DAB4|nr:uncharacterized protein LOC131075342 [Cryptomeria japonica]GLJ11074.1 hypothetical protein SUGI_0142150 [Cryptomeria japonica]
MDKRRQICLYLGVSIGAHGQDLYLGVSIGAHKFGRTKDKRCGGESMDKRRQICLYLGVSIGAHGQYLYLGVSIGAQSVFAWQGKDTKLMVLECRGMSCILRPVGVRGTGKTKSWLLSSFSLLSFPGSSHSSNPHNTSLLLLHKSTHAIKVTWLAPVPIFFSSVINNAVMFSWRARLPGLLGFTCEPSSSVV